MEYVPSIIYPVVQNQDGTFDLQSDRVYKPLSEEVKGWSKKWNYDASDYNAPWAGVIFKIKMMIDELEEEFYSINNMLEEELSETDYFPQDNESWKTLQNRLEGLSVAREALEDLDIYDMFDDALEKLSMDEQNIIDGITYEDMTSPGAEECLWQLHGFYQPGLTDELSFSEEEKTALLAWEKAFEDEVRKNVDEAVAHIVP